LVVQYGRWLGRAVQGDLGKSVLTGRSVGGDISNKLPISLSIALGGALFGVLIGVPAGIISGMRAGTKVDRSVVLGATMGLAIPNFVLAIILVLLFAVDLAWLPAVGFTRLTDSPTDFLKSLVLPSIALGTAVGAAMARQLRGELADVMSQSYVRTAWAKGGSVSRVVGKHALKNAAIPGITVLGLSISGLLGGTVLIEQILSVPGLGTYLLQGIQAKDTSVVLGCTLLFVVMYVTMSFLIDIAYGLVNPRVRVA
jgi:peptide/nickel transport system permease protein